MREPTGLTRHSARAQTVTYTNYECVIFREEETERTIKLDTWRNIKEKSSTAIADSRSKLHEIKSKDSRTTPEIQEQLEEIKVNKLAKAVKVN